MLKSETFLTERKVKKVENQELLNLQMIKKLQAKRIPLVVIQELIPELILEEQIELQLLQKI